MTRLAFALLFTAIAVSSAAADTIILDFNGSGIGAIDDSLGQPTGFTHRLPGSGSSIASNDPNLTVDTSSGYLLFQSTHSDFTSSVFGRNLEVMDAPSIRIRGLLNSNFVVRARFLNVLVNESSDQAGVFVGTSVDEVVRGGMHELIGADYQSFFTYSKNASDIQPAGGEEFAFASGQDAEIELGRINGNWHFRWTNLTDPSKSGGVNGFSIPDFDNESDFYFGLFNLDPRNSLTQTATVDQFVIQTGQSIPEPSALLLTLGFIGLMRRSVMGQ